MSSWRNPRPGGPLPRYQCRNDRSERVLQHHRPSTQPATFLFFTRSYSERPTLSPTPFSPYVYAVPSLHPLSTHFPHTIPSIPPTSLSPRPPSHSETKPPIPPSPPTIRNTTLKSNSPYPAPAPLIPQQRLFISGTFTAPR